ncbi:unnamed protein product [Nyctereutes procyonoides]|uniref:(raccoon dog) hypothetical protein n=1 Tax=Nyctereutes procyonoides TaxID=34880 RepID=A0A811XY20_NYCPR|nr:unnamed protein product [Nyctereutes procyonoides]
MQGQKKHIGYFGNLKVDSRNVTNSMTFATKSSHQNLIIFLNKIQTTIIGYNTQHRYNCDLFAILDQLDPDTLPDGRIWLTSKRVGVQVCAQMGFLVLLIMPLLVPLVTAELPGSTEARHLPILPAPRA